MRCCASSLPSAIVTAAPTQMSATSVAAETAAKTAIQTIGSSGSRTTTRPSTTNSATHVPSVNCARLKNALKVGISRSNASATDEPTSPASTSSWAGQEQQARHERQLAERQRVRAAAEVEVHHPALRGGEAGRHEPPRHVQLARPHADRLHEAEVGERRGRGHHAREEPDLRLEAELLSEDSHRPTSRSRSSSGSSPSGSSPGSDRSRRCR